MTITVHLNGKLVVDLTLEHLVAQWAHWTAEAQRLSTEYDTEKDKYVAREVYKGRRHANAVYNWEGTRTAKKLLAQGEWAHRKAQTFAMSVMVARELTTRR